MKKSTYILIGAVLLGWLASIIISWRFISSHTGSITPISLSGEEVVIPLGHFSEVIYSEGSYEGHMTIDNFKGIMIEASDSAKVPELRTTAGWSRYLRHEVKDGCLTVEVDMNAMCDSAGIAPQSYGVIASSDDWRPIRIVMPASSLRKVGSDTGVSVYADGFRLPVMKASVEGRLVLDNCVIDTLESRDIMLQELKLNGSRISLAVMDPAPMDLTVTSADSTSCIGMLRLDGASVTNADEYYLDLRNGYIGDMQWHPADSVVALDLQLGKPLTTQHF